ncbi:MAG: FAD/NAD(P)-binding oxidoreductase [Sulfurimonas sp.]|nr:FAD/NAD(P)-binding oxidoreductase [Sulfurimonas sp.]
MRVVIIGGGISAAYLANKLKKEDSFLEVLILSDESHPPYDRIHLCHLLDASENLDGIALQIDPTVKIQLNQFIEKIDKKSKRVFSKNSMFSYDKLIIATGSLPTPLFDISDISNAAVFRSANDCELIKNTLNARKIVIVGGGPIGLELLETLNEMPHIKSITLLLRAETPLQQRALNRLH